MSTADNGPYDLHLGRDDGKDPADSDELPLHDIHDAIAPDAQTAILASVKALSGKGISG
jgi:hypothetical protein